MKAVVLSLSLALLLGIQHQANAQAPDRPTVLTWGDSITWGYTPYMEDRKGLYWNITNGGVGGETSWGGKERLENDLLDNAAPQYAVIMYGTNDAVRYMANLLDPTRFTDHIYSPRSVAENLLAMAEMLSLRGTKVVVGLPLGVVPRPPGYEGSDDIRRILQDFLAETRVEMKRILKEYERDPTREFASKLITVDFRTRSLRFFADAFHLNEQGNQVLVPRLIKAVDKQMRRP